MKITLISFLLLILYSCIEQKDTADTIFYGGEIVTVDDSIPTAEAIAVKDGKIIKVGSLSEVNKLKGDKSNVVDLKGKTLIPGFIDGHIHFGGLGAQAVGANLLASPDGSVESVDQLVEVLKDYIKTDDASVMDWVFGLGYDDAVLKERRHPTKFDLDKVSKDRPIMVIHISGHFAAVNSAGLKKIGYTAQTKDPKGGIIRRVKNSKEPNGVLEELAAIPYMIGMLSPATKELESYFFEKAQMAALKNGITTAQEGRAFRKTHDSLKSFASSGKLKLDIVSYIDYANKDLLDEVDLSGKYVNGYRVAGLKVTLDGSPQGRTAWRTKPYILPPDGQKEGYLGYPAFPNEEKLQAIVDEAHKNKWQTLFHANGDAAIDQMIQIVKKGQEKHGEHDNRNVLIHGQFMRQDQIEKVKELKIFPSIFSMHAFYWGDWYYKIVGEKQAQAISPTKSILNSGMKLTIHSDAPVALPNMLNIMSVAVNRSSRSGKVIGESERLTPLEALKALTLWSAYQHKEEESKGSIEVGKLADLVILDGNPLKVDKENIGKIKVLKTFKEGQLVFEVK